MERVDNSPLETERPRVMEFFFRIADGCVRDDFCCSGDSGGGGGG
jgi:hypothetical protein